MTLAQTKAFRVPIPLSSGIDPIEIRDVPGLDAFAADMPVNGTDDDVRRIDVYDPHAAFDLVNELEFLSARAIEPNVFFSPRFLVPAMPRLDERAVRLMVARDEGEGRSRLRFLMPFHVERLARPSRRMAVRAWTHPFGPLGTLPLDRDDPVGTTATLFAALRAPERGLPDLLILPDLPIRGAMADVLMEAAKRQDLPFTLATRTTRARLDASGDPATILRSALGSKGYRDHRRRLRLLEGEGRVEFEAVRDADAVRAALEDFLALEASGWKGRGRSALLLDRHRAAFAREAVDGLAAQGKARIFTLRLDGKAAASLVVLVSNGEAAAWKTAYDERLARFGPGALVAAFATRALTADPEVRWADSCAVPDHGVMNRLWRERIEIGTLVIGLHRGMDEAVADAAAALQASRRRLNRRRILRRRASSLFSFPARLAERLRG